MSWPTRTKNLEWYLYLPIVATLPLLDSTQSVIHNRVSSITRFPYLKKIYNHWISQLLNNRDFLCWLTLKNMFQKEHIPKRDIPFWSHYEKGTFHFHHIPKRQMSKRASHFEHIFITLKKEQIPKRACFKKNTFKKEQSPKLAHSNNGIFQKRPILFWSNSKNISFQ